MSHTYEHIIGAFSREIWAIEESKYFAIRKLLRLRASGGRVSDEEIAAVVKAAERPAPTRGSSSVAILPLFGTITHRANMFSESSGGTSTQGFGKAFAQVMGDPNVSAVIIEADSPGGGVSGLPELADQIYKARGTKPIVAVANTRALSAAYWIVSQADEIVVSPSAEVGSVGVFLWLENWAKNYEMDGIQPEIIRYGEHKAEANDWEPLTEETRAYLKSQVDKVGEMFTAAVSRGRGISAKVVRSDFGQGRGVMAKDAVALGMADKVATMDETIERMASGRWKPPNRLAAESIDVRRVAADGTVTRTSAHYASVVDDTVTVTLSFDDQAAAIAEAAEGITAGDARPSEPPIETPKPEEEPRPEVPPEAAAEAVADDDGFDEIARLRVQEWEQSDVEARTEAEVR